MSLTIFFLFWLLPISKLPMSVTWMVNISPAYSALSWFITCLLRKAIAKCLSISVYIPLINRNYLAKKGNDIFFKKPTFFFINASMVLQSTTCAICNYPIAVQKASCFCCGSSFHLSCSKVHTLSMSSTSPLQVCNSCITVNTLSAIQITLLRNLFAVCRHLIMIKPLSVPGKQFFIKVLFTMANQSLITNVDCVNFVSTTYSQFYKRGLLVRIQ